MSLKNNKECQIKTNDTLKMIEFAMALLRSVTEFFGRDPKWWCRVVGGNSLAAISEQMIVGRFRRRGQAWQVGLAEPRSPIH